MPNIIIHIQKPNFVYFMIYVQGRTGEEVLQLHRP